MNIEDRLTEALRPYRDHASASLELWDRIEARTHRRRPVWQWGVAIGMALVVVIVGLLTIELRRDASTGQVTAATATQEEFVAAATRACNDFRPKLTAAKVVFPTGTGYAAVADQLAQIANSALLQVGALPVPEVLRGSAAANLVDLRGAIADAGQAGAAARNNDLRTADVEIGVATGAINRVANRLANDGAGACRP
ncbi:MAG TPA: hypothetical protein VKJ07_21690 [Mycobacteriales bacterium]|nr:hypothetical protein [Mycobacteriales bacterium]